MGARRRPTSRDLRRYRHVIGGLLATLLVGGLAFVAAHPTLEDVPEASQAATSSTASPPPYVAIPGCYNRSVPPAERPDKLNILGCASVAVALQGISWRYWGSQGADGTGTAVFKVCEPNCAAGYQLTEPVVVHAWNPQPPQANATCPVGLRIFADLILAFPKEVPPQTAQQMNTQYDGMPAVHYANYSAGTPDKEFIGTTFCY
jgi:hypothetical protein